MKHYYRYQVAIKTSTYGGVDIYHYDHEVRIHDWTGVKLLNYWGTIIEKNFPLVANNGNGFFKIIHLRRWDVIEYHLITIQSFSIRNAQVQID